MGTLVWMFAKAVWWGSLAGAAPFIALFTLPLATSGFQDFGLTGALLVISYPLIVTVVIVLGAALLIGLPLTAILRQSGRELQRHYAIAGLITGVLVPSLILLAFDGGGYEPMLFFAVPGMIAGTVTGLVWGEWREALATEATSADA